MLGLHLQGVADVTAPAPGDARDVRRARTVRRMATTELTTTTYGPAAQLGTTPPGPRSCPASCPWCAARWPTDWWGTWAA